MKSLIVLVLGLLSVGCGKDKETPAKEITDLNLPTPPVYPHVIMFEEDINATDQNASRAEPVKELTPEQKQKTLRDSVVGEYELKEFRSARFLKGAVLKQVYLENGVREWYINSTKQGSFEWSIVDGEIHYKYGSERIYVWRINPDKSHTEIAYIEDGKRTDHKKENQWTFKKIK